MATRSSLLRISTCLGLILAVFAVHTPGSLPSTDPDVVDYLKEVFDGVKGSGRKPINEELNLLPNESEGFANMVRCFSADHLGEYSTNDACFCPLLALASALAERVLLPSMVPRIMIAILMPPSFCPAFSVV